MIEVLKLRDQYHCQQQTIIHLFLLLCISFLTILLNLFLQPKIPNRNLHSFSETELSETETETFKKIGKSLETKNSHYRNITICYAV